MHLLQDVGVRQVLGHVDHGVGPDSSTSGVEEAHVVDVDLTSDVIARSAVCLNKLNSSRPQTHLLVDLRVRHVTQKAVLARSTCEVALHHFLVALGSGLIQGVLLVRVQNASEAAQLGVDDALSDDVDPTVANADAGQLDHGFLGVVLCQSVLIQNVSRNGGNVDSSVGFTKNVQITSLVAREDLVEGLQELVERSSDLKFRGY